jgi:hypothetical protein
MLLPAVHFCSQVTLRPWFFDERYWYVPLVPLSLFAATLLTHGTKLSSGLGAIILAITLPGAIGFVIAGMVFLITISSISSRPELEIQRTIATLVLTAIALVLWQRCVQIRLRADEAAGLHAQLNKIISETPPPSPIALLEFTEQAAEPALSLNGSLQWLLTPPFALVNVPDRFFFAYPTWNSPPTNRYWDRTTPRLLERVDAGQEVSLYSWNSESREFRSLGCEKALTGGPSAIPDFQTIPLEVLNTASNSRPTAGESRTSWHSTGGSFDPKFHRVLGMRLNSLQSEAGSVPLEIKLRWISRRSPQWSAAKEIRVHPPTSLAALTHPSQAELWLYPGRRVDWLLGGGIVELRVTANQPLVLEQVQVGKAFPESVLKEAYHSDEYASPEMKFLWESEFWWRPAK